MLRLVLNPNPVTPPFCPLCTILVPFGEVCFTPLNEVLYSEKIFALFTVKLRYSLVLQVMVPTY